MVNIQFFPLKSGTKQEGLISLLSFSIILYILVILISKRKTQGCYKEVKQYYGHHKYMCRKHYTIYK